MSESLREHFQKSQTYLKLGDKETIECAYINWEPIVTKFGKKAYRFNLERADGSRFTWDTGNTNAIRQFSDLIDKGLVKGMKVKILREGINKDDTRYTITESLPF